MSQKRYINFGTDADAGKVKAINSQFFAPQVLRADEPFFSASPPDQLLIQPHSCIFESGIVLVEDEEIAITISTSFNSANYTLYYEHLDEDNIGGIAASLKTAGGLLQTVDNGVILGWVVYPGGSVPLDSSMLYSNFRGQVTPGFEFKELTLPARIGIVNTKSDGVSSGLGPITSQYTIPSVAPYTVTATDSVLSNLLLTSKQGIRVYCRDDNSYMTRVGTTPSIGEYAVNPDTEVFLFNSLDAGKTIQIFDIAYGEVHKIENTDSSAGYIHRMFSFPASDAVIKTIFVEYVGLKGTYTIDPIEVIDVNGDSGTLSSSKVEPSPFDGSISRLTVRLIEGIYIGTSGEQFILRLRESVGGLSEGLLLRVRASAYDLPF